MNNRQLFSPNYILLANTKKQMAIGFSPFLYEDLQKKNGLNPRGAQTLILGLIDNLAKGEKELRLSFGKNKVATFLALKELMTGAIVVVTNSGTGMAYDTIVFHDEDDLDDKTQKFCHNLLKLVNNPRQPTVVEISYADIGNLDLVINSAYRKAQLTKKLAEAAQPASKNGMRL